MWRIFGVDESKLPSGHYRELCRALIHELNETDRNWRNGNFKTTSNRIDLLDSHVTIGNDCIVRHSNVTYCKRHRRTKLDFFHGSSPKPRSSLLIPDGWFAVTNTDIVVLWDKKNIKIVDTDGQLICEPQELDEDERVSWNLASCYVTDYQMAVFSKTDGQEKLSLWDVRNPPNVTRLKTRCFKLNLEQEYLFTMDDQFIAVSTYQNKTTNFYFFSKNTLNLHWQKTVGMDMRNYFVYGQGMLLLYVERSDSVEFGLIEMYDVTSGQFVRGMRTPVKRGPLEYLVGFNSKFIVVAHFGFAKNKMDVYDLKAIKNPTADGIMVRTLVVNNYFFGYCGGRNGDILHKLCG
jgi:hypothetical protein